MIGVFTRSSNLLSAGMNSIRATPIISRAVTYSSSVVVSRSEFILSTGVIWCQKQAWGDATWKKRHAVQIKVAEKFFLLKNVKDNYNKPS